MIKHCRKCGDVLNEDNWSPTYLKIVNCICRDCDNKQSRLWKKNNPEKVKVHWIRAARKRGHLPMSENKDCPTFLGIHVAERVLRYVFNDVDVMPYGYEGYDFICNHGKRIDVKSSCIHHDSRWMFTIRHNKTADYFLCLAFDNREDLNPLHVWLLPSEKFNHLTGTGITKNTIHKWDKYKLDIDKISACCNTMKTRDSFK